MKTYIVKLENHDDVISARDKISWSKARRVLLVWPRRGVMLHRRLDLLLVQRHCSQLGAQLAIVTYDGQVRSQALELGIPVFRNPIQAQQAVWRRFPAASANLKTGRLRPGGFVAGQELRQQRKQLRLSNVESYWIRLSAFILGSLAFLALAFFFYPEADVTVKLARRTQQITIPISLQTGITQVNASGAIPAEPLTVIVEGRNQADATSRVVIPDQAARGAVLLTNLSEQPVDLPQGSIVLTMGAVKTRYATTRGITIPGGVGKTQVVGIQAVFPGSSGNIPSERITALEGQQGLRVSVTNPEPVTGGSDRVSPAPAPEDYQRLKQKILNDLRDIAMQEMRSQIQPGQRLVEKSIQMSSVVSEQREPPENQPADRLQLTLQVEFQALRIAEDDLQAVAQSALDANLPPSFQAAPESLSFQMDVEQQTTGANYQGHLKAQRTLKAIFPEQKALDGLRGKEISEAVQLLQSDFDLANRPVIEIIPSWWNRLPFLLTRIRLVER